MTFVHGYEFDAMSRRPVHREMTRRLVDICAVGPGGRVADIGCGSGSATALLLEHSPHIGEVVAIDPSPHELAIARERLPDPRVRFLRGRAQDAETLIDPVDAVVLSNVIHQIPESERGSVIRSCHRMLRPRGRCVLNTHFYQGALPRETQIFYAHWLYATRAWLRAHIADLAPGRPRPDALSMLTPQDHRELFEMSGFAEVRSEEFVYECSEEDWCALSGYSVFIEGATGLTDMALGSAALKAGLRVAFDRLGLRTVPRRWLFVVGVK
jgi:ubiquinone/menaquinone biosynthesis C-methylase UbiE